MKKLLSLFLCLVILSTMCSCGAAARDPSGDETEVIAEGKCGDRVYWRLYEDGLLSVYGKGDMWDYDEYNNSPWLKYTSSIKCLYFSDRITKIGNHAFAYKTKISGNLKLPDDLKIIGERAFVNCLSLTGSLVIPDGVTTIMDYAFYGCESFTGDLIIPESVKTIGKKAFCGCMSLKGRLTIDKENVEIGEDAFSACGLSNLRSLGFKVFP